MAQPLPQATLWAAPHIPFLPWGAGAADLGRYVALLLKWNRTLNLSGAKAPLPLLRDLIQDSFFLASLMQRLELPADARIWDLGAGAGLPGIPLRIFFRRGHYTWVERNQKRAIFLQTALAQLPDVPMGGYVGDVETFLQDQPEGAHVILSRAFRPWPQLLPLCLPSLSAEGRLILMTNDPPPAALPAPWKLTDAVSYTLLADKQRWLWVCCPSRPAAR